MSSRAPRQLSGATRARIVGGLAVLAGGLTAFAMRSGPGMTFDSVFYAAAARGVAESGEASTLAGNAFTTYPPGIPILIGTVMRTGLDVEWAAALLNVATVVLMVVATYRLAGLALRSPTLALLPAAIVSVATPTVMLYSRLWSEPVFALLTLVLLIAVTTAVLRRRLDVTTVVQIAASASAAVWIRYIGIALLPIAALGAALAMRGRGAARIAGAAVGVGLLSAIGVAALVARNHSLGSGPFGDRTKEGSGVTGYVPDTLSTLGQYLVPQPLSVVAPLVGLLLALLLAFGAWRAVRSRDAAIAMLLAFISCYWLTLLAIGLVAEVEFMRYRLASPAFGPLAIVGVYAAREAWRESRGRARSATRVGLATALILVLPLALAQSVAYAWLGAGHGYANPRAMGSALARAAALLPLDARLASNDPPQLYWVTERAASTYARAVEHPAQFDFLVVFTSTIPGTSRSTSTNPAVDGLRAEIVEEYEDGTLYAIQPAMIE